MTSPSARPQAAPTAGRCCAACWNSPGAWAAQLAPNSRRWPRCATIRGRLRVVASTREVYGNDVRVPDDAEIYFQGEDRHVGPLTKYARLEPESDGNA